MSDESNRLFDVRLDDRNFIARNPEVEHERRVAIYDLLEDNYFRMAGTISPISRWRSPISARSSGIISPSAKAITTRSRRRARRRSRRSIWGGAACMTRARSF